MVDHSELSVAAAVFCFFFPVLAGCNPVLWNVWSFCNANWDRGGQPLNSKKKEMLGITNIVCFLGRIANLTMDNLF
jgi:hypothetical protein